MTAEEKRLIKVIRFIQDDNDGTGIRCRYDGQEHTERV